MIQKNPKPDVIVAKKVINQLVEKNLLSNTKRDEWFKKLSSGKITSEDWNLLADFYIKEKGETS